MAIAPGSLTGVRCVSCGARPSSVTRPTSSAPPRDVILPRPSGPAPTRMYPVPMAASRRGARPAARNAESAPIGFAWPVATTDLAEVRSWISDLPLQAKSAIITAAAACVALAIALTVTVTLA